MDRESIRKELRCTIHPLNSLKTYKYTVICSNFNGKWIYNYVINPAIIKNSDTPPIRPYLPPFIKDYTND